jgi:hypothetical protein
MKFPGRAQNLPLPNWNWVTLYPTALRGLNTWNSRLMYICQQSNIMAGAFHISSHRLRPSDQRQGQAGIPPQVRIKHGQIRSGMRSATDGEHRLDTNEGLNPTLKTRIFMMIYGI